MASSSPYASPFKTAISNGTPCSKAVEGIASRKGTTPSVVFNSLFRAGLVHRQKFNGKWIYWPAECKKSSATQRKTSQFECWQSFIDWVVASGFATPDKLWSYSGSQSDFMAWCRKYFAKQFATSSSTSRKRKSARKSTRRRTTARRRPTTSSRRRTTSTRRRTSTTARRRSTGTSRRRPSTTSRRRSTSTSRRRPSTASRRRSTSTTGTRRRTSSTARRRSTSSRSSYRFPRSTSSSSRRYRRAA